MKYEVRILAVCLLVGIALTLSPEVGAQLLGPEYRLNPGDVLVVQVFGEPDIAGEYTIGPAGTITLPQIGQVYLRNMTLDEAQQELTKRVGELLRFPHVVLSINEMASSRKVYVSGYVERQGPLVLPFGATVVDAISGAGTGDLSDLRRVKITHPGESAKTLDLSGLRTDQPMDITEYVQYGDVIYVPKVQDKIAVLGQVNKPGTVYLPVGEEVTVLDVLSRVAQGLSAGADRSSALLIRKEAPAKIIDLNKLLKQGDITENVTLQAGDVLVVHEAANMSVVGEVTHPATFRSGEPVTVLEALAQAGGFTLEADLEQAQIFSAAGEARAVNLEALLKEGDLSQNLLLAPGDILVVPEAEPETIMMVGAVSKPGVLNIAHQKERDVLRIVTAAGPTPLADLRHVTIYRGEQQLVANLQAVMDEGKLEENIEVEPGDVVMVHKKETLYVLGAVGQQGRIAWEPDMTIFEALVMAGSITERAYKDRIHLVRTRPDGTWEHVQTAMQLEKGIPMEPLELKPGDIIYVQARGVKRPILTLIRDALWMFGALRSVL